MSAQESDLFAQEMLGVAPLKQTAQLALQQKREATPGQQYRRQRAQFSEQEIHGPLSLVLKQPLKAEDWISYKRDGIQTGVFKNLRLGHYPHEAVLNLMQKNPREARDELLQFMQDCDAGNIRSVLITFGSRTPANLLLKSYLAQWLPELEQVQACHTALKQHGGTGAIYVLLRKSAAQRLENRERHAARLG